MNASAVEIELGAPLGVGADLEQEQLALDGLVGRELGDAEHVDELVDLLLDLLERVMLGVDAQRDARDAGALGRPDGERVDVEAAAGEHRRDAGERAGLVLEEDRDRVLHDVASTGSSYSTMSIAAAPAGIIGKHCSAGSTRQSIDDGAVERERLAQRGLELGLGLDEHPDAAVGLGELDVVRHVGAEVDVRAAAVEEHVLPLRDHAEVAVVDEHDDDREVVDAPRSSSSCAVIWKQPSPSTQTTVASGRAAFAPIAAGIP